MEQELLDNDMAFQNKETIPSWAGFWIRVGASLIDGLTYLPIIGFNFYNLYSLKNLPAQIIIDIILLFYKPFMEYKYGATLGKMAVKIKVVNANFEPLTLPQSVIRNYPYWLSQVVTIITTIYLFNDPAFQSATTMIEVSSLQNQTTSPVITFLISIITLISCLMVAFTAKKQGLHDMIAKTYCIYKDQTQKQSE